MRLKDSRKTSAPSATVWWNVRMMRLRLVGRRLGLVALVLVPVLRLAVLVLCLVLRLIPVPMGLLVLHLFRPVLRRLTTKWRNTCDRAIRSCSATCCTRPAISCTTVSPCRIAGTKPAGAFRVRFSRIGHTGIKNEALLCPNHQKRTQERLADRNNRNTHAISRKPSIARNLRNPRNPREIS